MALAKFICFTSQPRFQHDCNKCKFLGIVSNPLDMYDMYVCGSSENDKSYVLRYDHRPDANRSLPAHIVSHLPEEGDPYNLVKKLDKLGRPPAMYRVD